MRQAIGLMRQSSLLMNLKVGEVLAQPKTRLAWATRISSKLKREEVKEVRSIMYIYM